MINHSREQILAEFAKTTQNYIYFDGIYYLRTEDGRVWCPSAQGRGARYKNITLPSFTDSLDVCDDMSLRDFIAIDVETVCTDKKHYPCQIGIAVVHDGVIEETVNRLIKPPGNKYDKKTMAVHHITPEMTKNAPSFRVVWDDIKMYFEDSVIIAHNAKFDIGVLDNAFKKYDIDYPQCQGYICTYRHLTNENLEKSTARYGVHLDSHHDALADAIACAELYLAISSGYEKKSDEEVESIIDQRNALQKENFKPIQLDLFN